jgi:multidrug efflux pump subunit AcrA (membrane-fusion protein)
MSTTPTVKPRLPKPAVPSRAHELAAELSRLAGEDVSPGQFHQELLHRVVSTLGAVGGAVWLRSGEGQLELAGEVNLQATGLLDDEAYRSRHGKLVQRVLATGQAAAINQPAAAGPTAADNASDMLLLFGPLKHNAQTQGLVEIFHAAADKPGDQKELLGVVLKACEAATAFHAVHATRGEQERQALWSQLEEFTRAVHAGLDPRATAYTIANEGRRLIGCDRLSVAVLRGGTCRIEAVSGQDLLDQRANPVRRLQRLATAVASAREPLWFSGEMRDLPPQLERAAQAYADQSQSKMVAVLPVFRDAAPGVPRRRAKAIGALVVEQIEDATPREGFRQRAQVVCDHAGLALGNALEHHSLFLLPLWRLLGRLGLVVKFRTLPKTLMVLSIIAGIVAALMLVPCDFNLDGRGTLQPVLRQEVFARIDGQVVDVRVKHLDQVAAGTPLVEMRSSDLDNKITELEGKIQAVQKDLQSVETLRIGERRSMTPLEEKQLTGRKQELEAMLASLREQLALQKQKKTDLVVRSPLNGTVTTLDVRDRLTARPVQRGDALLSVADLAGAWELEVRMPEDRMGHILLAREELLRQRREQPASGLPPDLPVKFILATDPGVTFEGVVKEIHQRAEVRGDEGNTVLVKVAIDKSELPQLRPGASVIAKVHCGRRSVGYVWFHDVIEFVQSRILFRF